MIRENSTCFLDKQSASVTNLRARMRAENCCSLYDFVDLFVLERVAKNSFAEVMKQITNESAPFCCFESLIEGFSQNIVVFVPNLLIEHIKQNISAVLWLFPNKINFVSSLSSSEL